MTLAALSESLSSIVEAVGKSVVRIEGGHRRPASGVVWSPRQIITTARAVPRDEVVVEVEGRQLQAKVKGRDGASELALLELDEALTPATFDDGERLKVGQLVLKLARPGETVRAKSGIVGTLGRKPWRTPGGTEIDFFLEADADHAPGFSGGPLVDLEGRVLGLNTTGLLRGQSVTVPAKTLRRLVAQLEQHGRVRRSYLGLQLQPLRLPDAVQQQTGEEVGLLVTAVEKDGPADQAGLQYGDTVLHLGDDSVKTLQDLYRYLRQDHAGEQVPLTFFRNGQVTKAQVTLGGR